MRTIKVFELTDPPAERKTRTITCDDALSIVDSYSVTLPILKLVAERICQEKGLDKANVVWAVGDDESGMLFLLKKE